MFKDTYKKAMDNFSPREGLLEEIFKKAESGETARTTVKALPKRKKVFRYAASVAAAIVICVGAVAYPVVYETFNDYENKSANVSNEKRNENSLTDKSENIENIKEQTREKTAEDIGETKKTAGQKSEAQASAKQANKAETKDDVKEVLPKESSRKENIKTDEQASYKDKSAEQSTDKTSETAKDSEEKNLPQQEDNINTQSFLAADNMREKSADSNDASAGAQVIKSAANDSICAEFDYNQDIKNCEDIVFTNKKNNSGAEAKTEYDALCAAKKEYVQDYEYTNIYCDYTNEVWRVDFVLKSGKTAARVYVAFDGDVIATAKGE